MCNEIMCVMCVCVCVCVCTCFFIAQFSADNSDILLSPVIVTQWRPHPLTLAHLHQLKTAIVSITHYCHSAFSTWITPIYYYTSFRQILTHKHKTYICIYNLKTNNCLVLSQLPLTQFEVHCRRGQKMIPYSQQVHH